jgi:hypothetical protein
VYVLRQNCRAAGWWRVSIKINVDVFSLLLDEDIQLRIPVITN